MIYRVEIQITTPVHDTEITDRVEDAVQNLFPNVTFERHPNEIVGETHSLEQFAALLHEQEILDTARREFFKNADDESFRFSVKKQAAFRGIINFAVGSPDELGDIGVTVTVHDPDVESYIDHTVPPTEDGQPQPIDTE
jgi:Uncharacterized protein conserved in archaea